MIDASKLGLTEKALILYRHAKHSVNSEKARDVVREHALSIVRNPDFTPERIRRFVVERLPEIVDREGQLLVDSAQMEAEVREAISNPTKRMKTSFIALTRQQKSFLIAMLETGAWPTCEKVKAGFLTFKSSSGPSTFEDVFEQLTDSFVTAAHHAYISWIHPSYRDLVIDQLHADGSLRQEFLERASVRGIKLAVSHLGGPTGARHIPLLVDDSDWERCRLRAAEVVSEAEPSEIADLLTSVTETIESNLDGASRGRLIQLLNTVCAEARRVWSDPAIVFGPSELKAYSSATLLLDPLPDLPNLSSSWNASVDAVASRLSASAVDENEIEQWVEMAREIRQSEPRFLAQRDFPKAYETEIDLLLQQAKDQLDIDIEDDYRSEASRLSSLSASLHKLAEFLGDDATRAKEVADRLAGRASRLEEKARDEDETPEDDSDFSSWQRDNVDVRNIFIDL